MQDILSENRHSASELSYYFQMKGRKQMAQVNLEIATCTAHKKAPRHFSKHQDAFSASAIQTGNYACAGAPTGQTSAQAPHSTHTSGSIWYWVSPSEIAFTGQPSAQAPHMMQASEIL
jgi:hypothetical protein